MSERTVDISVCPQNTGPGSTAVAVAVPCRQRSAGCCHAAQARHISAEQAHEMQPSGRYAKTNKNNNPKQNQKPRRSLWEHRHRPRDRTPLLWLGSYFTSQSPGFLLDFSHSSKAQQPPRISTYPPSPESLAWPYNGRKGWQKGTSGDPLTMGHT